MKWIFTLLSCIFFTCTICKGQYVNIPDSNFRNALIAQFPACFNAAKQMDTTCAATATLTLNVNGDSIESLEGVQYFKMLQSLYCAQNKLTTLPALPNTITNLLCDENKFITLPPLPPLLWDLSCANNKLTALPPLPASLNFFNCDGNMLTSLPSLSSTQLKRIYCSLNRLTSLPDLPPTLTDLKCDNNLLTNLPLLPAGLTSLSANANFISALAPLPANLQYLSITHNAVDSLPALPNSLFTLAVGYNNIAQLPVLPADLSKLAIDSNSLITQLPFLPATLNYLGVWKTGIHCLPKLPSTLVFIDFDSLQIRCLPNFVNGLVVYDSFPKLAASYQVCNAANNAYQCESFPQVFGFIFNDNDSNGVYNAGDTARGDIKVQLNNRLYAYSDINGHFHLSGDTIGSYSIDIFPPPFFSPLPFSNIHNFSSYSDVVYDTFALQRIIIEDSLSIHITSLQAAGIPALPFSYHVKCENAGASILPTDINMRYDTSRLVFDSSSLPGQIIAVNDSLLLNKSLLPGEVQTFFAYFHVKPAAVVGDTVVAIANAKSMNVKSTDTARTILNSFYDPNDKEATPTITPLQVASGFIEYVIRFQNVGTDTVHNVVITDTLSNRVRTDFVQLVQASHPCRTILNAGVITFELLNIILPDSGANQAGSKGFVRFRVRPDSTLLIGETVSNKASISFDYNSPIVTSLHYTTVKATVLPLQLLTFTAKKEGKTNLLQWSTANETNVDRFEVQRSANGSEYRGMQNVKSKMPASSSDRQNGGTNEYNFTDYSPLTTHNFYRLKMVNKDGSLVYSPTREVSFSILPFAFSIYPNPAKDKLQVQIESEKIATLQMQVLTQDGKAAMSGEWTVQKGVSMQTLNASGLQKGTYFLKITSGNKEQSIVKFEKL